MMEPMFIDSCGKNLTPLVYVYVVCVKTFIVPLIKRALSKSIRKGHLTVDIPAINETLKFGHATEKQSSVQLILHAPVYFVCRMMLDWKVGLGESYVAGEWSCKPSVQSFLQLLINNRGERKQASTRVVVLKWFIKLLNGLAWLVNYVHHLTRVNSITGSRRNIRDHYDLGNDMFQLFLDPTMTYSSAMFQTPTDSLQQAQLNKLDTMLGEKLHVGPKDSLLEIGFGWGSCAMRAAEKFGCTSYTGLTISEQQLEMAQARVNKLGLQHKIQLLFQDYRLSTGQYDKLVSIEMIEAVGDQFLKEYFQVISDRLKPNGLACLQCITIPDSQYERYTKSSDFIRKHIFPGGHLPSIGKIKQSLPQDLTMVDMSNFSKDYAKTLDLWNDKWLECKKQVLDLGYDDRFHRKWQFYFCLCSTLFANGHIDVVHIVLEKSSGLTQSITH